MTGLRRAAAVAAVVAALALAGFGLFRATHPPAPSLADRVDAVAATLKCPTCAGLSIKDSTSVLATGSRSIIQQQLRQGRTPDQVRQYFVDRYGPQVLLSPQDSGPGLLAWVLPGVAVLGAAGLAWRWTRRRRAAADSGQDAAEAHAALTAFREGRLEPAATPAGDALHAALLARIAAEEDASGEGAAETGGELLARADARLAAAYRRYTAPSVNAPSVDAPSPKGSAATRTGEGSGRRSAVPRRALLVGSAAALVVVAGAGVGMALENRAPGQPVTGNPLPAAAAAPATGGTAPADGSAGTPPNGVLPSPPPGYTGGMPTTAPQWVTLARAYDKARRYPQALAAYGMALRLEPGADDVVLMRDDVLVRSGQPQQALSSLRQLAARYPDNTDVLLILGLAQNRTGDPAAPATLAKFLQLAPDSPAAPGVRHLLGQS